MRLGTTTAQLARQFGEPEAIRKLATVGFDCLDYSSFLYPNHEGLLVQPLPDILNYYRMIKATADESSITFGQMHAPMPSYTGDPAEDEHLFALMLKSIAICHELDCPYLVIHPCIMPGRKYDQLVRESRELNLDFYTRLLPSLIEHNVKVGVENMFGWDESLSKACPTVCSTPEEMVDFIDTMNDVAGQEQFVACLDVGHANLLGESPVRMVQVLGQRLKLVHLHDNDGLVDRHTAPYFGSIDWPALCGALKDNGYSGSLSFEADEFPRKFPPFLVMDSMIMLHQIGRGMIAAYLT